MSSRLKGVGRRPKLLFGHGRFKIPLGNEEEMPVSRVIRYTAISGKVWGADSNLEISIGLQRVF